ncbi:MAG: GDP-mannose 4,6-dehydratase [Candidatus Nanopelagicales bacterium]
MTGQGGKTAFITGLAGQDGIYLGRYLTGLGYRIVGTVTSKARARAALGVYLPGADVYEIDVRNHAAIGVLLDRERPDEIYNLASWSSVGRSWSDPEQVTAVNGLSVLGLLEQVKHLRDTEGYDPRICQASSSEMFGLVTELPQTEGSPHHPRSPYAVSKSFAHHTAVNYRESYGMFVAAAILFNHESPLRPESFVTRKISAGAAAIALGRQDTLTLGRLDVRRDWGASADYVKAMHAILQHDRPDTFNVATGTSHALEDFLHAAFTAAGVADYRNRIESDPALLRPADVPETRGDASKAERELGWRPTQSFEEIVNSMVAADLTRLSTGIEHSTAYL